MSGGRFFEQVTHIRTYIRQQLILTAMSRKSAFCCPEKAETFREKLILHYGPSRTTLFALFVFRLAFFVSPSLRIHRTDRTVPAYNYFLPSGLGLRPYKGMLFISVIFLILLFFRFFFRLLLPPACNASSFFFHSIFIRVYSTHKCYASYLVRRAYNVMECSWSFIVKLVTGWYTTALEY